MAINNVVLVGNISTEPEIRTTQSGINCATFNVAVNRPRSKAQTEAGQSATADFIRCTAWRGSADLIQRYFHKGNPIGITGRIQTDQWTDQSGQKRYSTGVVVDTVSFVGHKSDNQQGGNGGYAQPQPQYQQQPAQMPATGYQQPAQQVGMDMGYGGGMDLEEEDLPF